MRLQQRLQGPAHWVGGVLTPLRTGRRRPTTRIACAAACDGQTPQRQAPQPTKAMRTVANAGTRKKRGPIASPTHDEDRVRGGLRRASTAPPRTATHEGPADSSERRGSSVRGREVRCENNLSSNLRSTSIASLIFCRQYNVAIWTQSHAVFPPSLSTNWVTGLGTFGGGSSAVPSRVVPVDACGVGRCCRGRWSRRVLIKIQ